MGYTLVSLGAAITLLVASSALAQRTSPQFNFPPPNFGADVFAANNQADQLSQLTQLGAQSQSAQLPSLTSTIDSQSQSLTLGQPQLISQSAGQLQQQQQARPQQEQSAPIQLSRPSLSLTSLTAPQQSSQQQVAQQPQRPVSSASSVSSAASLPSRDSHQSARHHSQSAARPTQQAATSSSSSSAARHHQQHHNQHPANLQTQQTSQSANAGSNQAAIESARKAEATAASMAATSGQSYQCPDSFGYFRHHKSCDKYYACDNGTATLKLCGNGLMFDDSDPKRENCAYPFSVDCGDRTDLEAPISTAHCPRLYGLFQDNANCRIFYSCWNGEASKYECPPGLAYDSEQRVCVWADTVDRCDQSEVSDGFVCPDPTEVDQPGHYTRHAHPTDCRKFYVCIEGVARPYGCSLGSVFNVDSLQCDEPENVSGCEKYYGDLDPKLAKKLARESVQGQSGSGSVSSSSTSGGNARRPSSSQSSGVSSQSSSSSAAAAASSSAAAASSSS